MSPSSASNTATVPVRASYASDRRRAQQTAAVFAAVTGLPVRTDARLRERSLSVLEGTPLRGGNS